MTNQNAVKKKKCEEEYLTLVTERGREFLITLTGVWCKNNYMERISVTSTTKICLTMLWIRKNCGVHLLKTVTIHITIDWFVAHLVHVINERLSPLPSLPQPEAHVPEKVQYFLTTTRKKKGHSKLSALRGQSLHQGCEGCFRQPGELCQWGLDHILSLDPEHQEESSNLCVVLGGRPLKIIDHLPQIRIFIIWWQFEWTCSSLNNLCPVSVQLLFGVGVP